MAARFDVAALRTTIARHRRESVAVACALIVIVVSLASGSAARARIAPAQRQRDSLRGIDQGLATFRAAFRPASLAERAFRLPDSLAISVSRDARFSVAQRVAQRAEQLGLTEVRVRFASVDSEQPPAATDLGDAPVAVADYLLVVDARGNASAAFSLVDQLPPSVRVEEMRAEHASVGDAAAFRLTLAVFETPGDSGRAVDGVDGAARVARLLPYAGGVADSDLVIRVPMEVALTRHLAVGLAATPAAASTEPRLAARPAQTAARVYHVTTTLMAGARRAALINDQLIYVGESLPDGSKLTTVERDRVVLTDPGGVTHTVAVAGEGER
jgi:hypothetical protein